MLLKLTVKVSILFDKSKFILKEIKIKLFIVTFVSKLLDINSF
jgi:hypothetical protein